MKRICATLALLALGGAAPGADERPRITGVSHLAVYAADMAASERFYTGVLGARKGADPEDAKGVRYYFSAGQFVEILPLPEGQGDSRLAHVAYSVADVGAMRGWLVRQGVADVSPVQRSAGGDWIETRDPEGNRVQFVQSVGEDAAPVPGVVSGRVIHVGYVVRDRAAEDRFYHTLLGFRPYWYGGGKPGETAWISQQVPDGHDWMEYMMVGPGSGLPLDKVTARTRGVLNHLSLGVHDMKATVAKMEAQGRLDVPHDGPKLGLDGKWQTNLYDPDGTRIELMEFQPVAEPCCSPFTAESPTQ